MRLARFTRENHVYGASRLPKTTVLQSKENADVELQLADPN